jgi:hypothetical protein
MITAKRFARIERAVREAGYGHIIVWSESVIEPRSAETFAAEAIYVICNSGLRVTVAKPIHRRCMRALRRGQSSSTVFGHPGKVVAIDEIWAMRRALFKAYRRAEDKLEFCQTLPWIGPVTKHHLAKNFGVDTAKPDVHLERLAKAEGISPGMLCARIAKQTGYRVATVDSILWRACADGILSSRRYVTEGWRAAFRPRPIPRFPIERLNENELTDAL